MIAMAELPATDIESAVPAAMDRESFLVFETSRGLFGLPVLGVNEILTLQHVTRLPNVEDEVLGVLNMRGDIIPMVDLNRKLVGTYASVTPQSRIIVAGVREKLIGLLVDRIAGVVHAVPENLSEAQMRGLSSDLIAGVSRSDAGIFLVLNPAALPGATSASGEN